MEICLEKTIKIKPINPARTACDKIVIKKLFFIALKLFLVLNSAIYFTNAFWSPKLTKIETTPNNDMIAYIRPYSSTEKLRANNNRIKYPNAATRKVEIKTKKDPLSSFFV